MQSSDAVTGVIITVVRFNTKENNLSEGSRRTALVTGGAGGIGIAASRALAFHGDRVVIADLDAGKAQAAAAGLSSAGLAASGAGVDVTSRAAVEQLVGRIAAEHGRIDVLVNMAGIVRNDVLSKVADADFEATLRSHLSGTLNCIRACIPHMKRRQFGRIVNMSSVASRGSLGGAAYGAAKGAIESLSRTAALELAGKGITVNCVAPGLIEAGMFLTTPLQFQEQGIARTPMKRAGTPEEVAACIVFFASSAAGFVTGQTLFVDGGLTTGF
ncbi:MAG TPA: SDR family oxidoreductase [Steroidobacteraceae bacterium]|jgi:3-oxoacyl-[acyl-carrier protein] reductase|nr:SDR family oxidoreductase [Steroidobacteraceae bacterium]